MKNESNYSKQANRQRQLGNMEIPIEDNYEYKRNIRHCIRQFEKTILTKHSTEDDPRKIYGIDYSVWKKADNKAQKYIITSVNEQPLQNIMNYDTAN